MTYVQLPHLQAGQSGARGVINVMIDNAADLHARVTALTASLAAETAARTTADAAEAQTRASADVAEAAARAAAIAAEAQTRASADAAAMPIAEIGRFWTPASRLAHEVGAHIDGPFARPAPADVVETLRGPALRWRGVVRQTPVLPVDTAREMTARTVLRRAPGSIWAPSARAVMAVEWIGAGAIQRVALTESPVDDGDWTELAMTLDPPTGAYGVRMALISDATIDVLSLEGWVSGPALLGPLAPSLRLAVTTRAALPAPTEPGLVRFVTDSAGGVALAVSDGAHWRQCALGDVI